MRYWAAPIAPVSAVVVDVGLCDGLDAAVALGEDAHALSISTATIARRRRPMAVKPRR
jgi:hypothetical protein